MGAVLLLLDLNECVKSLMFRQRFAEIVPLHKITADRLQDEQLFVLFYTFGHYLFVNSLNERDDRLHNHPIYGGIINMINEGLINFDNVCGQLLDIAEGREAFAEIIERDAHPFVPKEVEVASGRFNGLNEQGLRELKHEVAGSSPVSAKMVIT